MTFKPMLAATVTDRTKLRFPFLASPKLDGIRCVILDGKVLSRSLKPIRNKHVVKMLEHLPNMDGELIVGSANIGDVFNRTTRGIMSADGEPEFTYHAFDTLHKLSDPFSVRLAAIPSCHKLVQPVHHQQVSTLNDLSKFEDSMLANGYEGVMLRGLSNAYKCGRATANENSLWKVKQFMDGELLVLEVREGVENTNPTFKDALGETTRSMRQDGMVPNGKVGTIIGYDSKLKQTLEISPGRMTHDERVFYLKNQGTIIGHVIKYKAFGYGSLNVPRFATFQGFRDLDDMS